MVDYTFNGNQTISAFNVTADVLVIPSSRGTAAELTVEDSAAGVKIISKDGFTVTLTGVTRAQLSSAGSTGFVNTSIIGGGRLLVGDNNTASDLDTLGNNLVGTDERDHILGLGGNDTINGGKGSDFVHGGAGNDAITINDNEGNDITYGGGDNDTITSTSSLGQVIFGGNRNGVGPDGNDSITSGTGNDTIQGNQGDDTIVGGAAAAEGNDVILGGQGNDSIDFNAATSGNISAGGDKGNDTLIGGAGADTLSGGDGNDSINAGGGINLVNGNGGDDTLVGGASVAGSTIRGGQGNDSLTGGTAAALQFFGDLGNDTFVSGTGGFADTVFGGQGNDSYLSAAGGGAQIYSGDLGNDTFNLITGNIGSITVASGAGNDSISVFLDNAGTNVFGLTDYTAGSDTLAITTTAQDASALTLQTFNSSQITLRNGAAEEIQVSTTGNSSFNVINGGTTSMVVFNNSGTAGSLTGGTAGDYIISGDAGDTVTAGAGGDRIALNAGNDRLILTPDATADTASGGTGSDVLEIVGTTAVNNLGNQITGFETILFTGAGSRTINTGGSYATDGILAADTVTIDGSAATGVITVNSASDWGVRLNVTGGSSNDVINLSGNTVSLATVTGGAGNDNITGAAAASQLNGGIGNDTLSGGAGADTLTGGADGDNLVSAGGIDVFRFQTADFTANPSIAAQVDRVADFTNATDKIMIQGVTSGTTFTFVTEAAGANALSYAALLALSTVDGLTVVTTATAQTLLNDIGGVGVGAVAANENFLIVKSGTEKYVIFMDAGAALNTGNFDFTNDFLTFA